jgi:catechol 2,3-dioxygenase-like lactoylglutathione lyase family enzyme
MHSGCEGREPRRFAHFAGTAQEKRRVTLSSGRQRDAGRLETRPPAAGYNPPVDRVAAPRFRAISAITLATRDMTRAVRFYRALGFEVTSGGETAAFTSLAVGDGYLNLILTPAAAPWSWWGRVIVHVDDVDRLHARARAAGLEPDAPPRDAEWGERYFHLRDPDGHELSFARPL